MSTGWRPALLYVAAVLVVGATCGGLSQEVPRERAIDLARQHISFTPDSVVAERATVQTRRVWRVTFRGRLPGQPPGLFETITIAIDRRTGEVVSITRT